MTQPFPLHDAQVQMTLAAMAYLDDEDPKTHTIPPLPDVKAALEKKLPDVCFATKGQWKLDWGPVQTHGTDNLVYVARNTTDNSLAVCLRGTTTQFLSRLEDLPTSQRRFPTANTSGAKVSTEFFGGLAEMLAVHDPDQHTNLLDHLATSVAAGAPVVYVNGHSQGAALVPMVMAALQLGWAKRPALTVPVKGFAFAPPTSGNPEFAAWVNQALDCWFVVNPLDIVPLGYASIHDVIRDQIPGPLTLEEDLYIPALVDLAAGIAANAGPWAQPSQRAITQAMHQIGVGFFDMVIDQHNHNTYLELLGATPLIPYGCTGGSPFDPDTIPRPYITNGPVGS